VSPTNNRGSLSERVARNVWLTIVMMGACLMTMALSYHAALWYLRQPPAASVPGLAPSVEAEQLDGLSKELAALLRTYLDRIATEGSPPSQAFTRWATDSYCPRVNDLRRRIQASNATGAALSALLTASDKVYAMAKQPDQIQLRQVATENVLDAGAAVESRLATLRHMVVPESDSPR